MPTTEPQHTSRTRITLRISERLLAEAHEPGIDLDAAVDAGLEGAIRAVRTERLQPLAVRDLGSSK